MPAITKRIVGYAVASKKEVSGLQPETKILLTELTERPDVLLGYSYKIKPPEGHAIYITINNIELDGVVYPYEMFISSKDTASFQWIAAMTRLVSAVFRKGGEVKFIAEELQAIHDPVGGYFVKGHGFVPSIVAHIGLVLEQHLTMRV